MTSPTTPHDTAAGAAQRTRSAKPTALEQAQPTALEQASSTTPGQPRPTALDQSASTQLGGAPAMPVHAGPLGAAGRRAWFKPAGLALGIGVAAIVASLLPLETLPDHVANLGTAGPVAAVAVGATLLTVLFPRTLLSLACGALFGALGGATTSLVAALTAALVTFGVGRWAGREVVARRLRGRLAKVDTFLARRGLLAVVVTRLLPLGPFGLIGYLYGTSSTTLRHFILGTALGAAPSSFAYAAIGAAAVSPADVTWPTYLPAAGGLLISTSAALYWRYSARRSAA